MKPQAMSFELSNTCLSVMCKLVHHYNVAPVMADQPNFLHWKQTITFIGTITSLHKALALRVGGFRPVCFGSCQILPIPEFI